MIVDYLKYDFPREVAAVGFDVNVPFEMQHGVFALSDAKSCADCKRKRPSRAGCDENVVKVDSHGAEIVVVQFEEYLAQFKSLNSEARCDLLMAESREEGNKVVFCDLCCYDEKYVEPNSGKYPEGKRAKARQQMRQSVELLCRADNVTKIRLLTYSEKVCLFAWRDPNIPDEPAIPARGNARANMQVFGSVVSNMTAQATTHRQILAHGFTFMQIKYPSSYVW